MNITVDNRPLSGTVKVIQSKSFAHRIMLAAALAQVTGGGETEVKLENDSEDIRATKRVITALGSGEELLDCGESGTTFRFIVPICAALGRRDETRFTGHGRLLQRPMGPLLEAMEPHGVSFKYEDEALVCRGKLAAGDYSIAADVSSQYISGLLFALPLLDGDSTLNLYGKIESRPYIDITLDVLRRFGICIEEESTQAGGTVAAESEISASFRIRGNQKYSGPAEMEVEGDWSNAAFWMAAGVISGEGITVRGLNLKSVQGDKAICNELRKFGAEVIENEEDGSVTCTPPKSGKLCGCEIDAKDIPDAVPILSIVAAAASGETRIFNAGRLRIKESDRLATVSAMIKALGGEVEEGSDYLIIHGGGSSTEKPLNGGEVDGANDHRIVMSAAVAALICKNPVTIIGAQAVNKSYPEFFQEREKL